MEIQNYPDYLIYSDGRVFTKKRNKFLKSMYDKKGYQIVNLYRDGKRKSSKIHRLVGIHYIPNPENKTQIDHLNRIKSDNRVENLRWVSPSENQHNIGLQKNNKTGYKNIEHISDNKDN